MKMVRFGDAGHERPGLTDSSGTLRDLSGVADDWSGARLGPGELERIGRLSHDRYPAVDEVILPKGSMKSDWEAELGVVIGTSACYGEESEALSHAAGYCLVNDLSEREFQLARGGTWDKGKGCDTFGPIGPWLVTSDEIKDPQDIDLWLEVNGSRRQDGTTRNMIFSLARTATADYF